MVGAARMHTAEGKMPLDEPGTMCVHLAEGKMPLEDGAIFDFGAGIFALGQCSGRGPNGFGDSQAKPFCGKGA